MKPFSYILFLFLLTLGAVLILPETAIAEDSDGYSYQSKESKKPTRIRRRFRYRDQNNDGYRETSRRSKRRRTRRGTRKRSRSNRQLASYRARGASSYEARGGTEGGNSLSGSIGVVGGLSSSTAAFVDGFNSNIYMGLRGDLQYSYIGVEVDGFYGLASSRESTSTFAIGDATTESGQSNFGGEATLKGQIPIRLGSSAKIIPKLGAGYSLLSHTITSSSFETSTTTINVQSLHAMAGFDLYPIAKLLFSADYALGLFGSGSATAGDGSGAKSDSAGATLNRLRVGAFYEVANHLSLGAQFTRREYYSGTAFGDSMNQFLGVLMYTF